MEHLAANQPNIPQRWQTSKMELNGVTTQPRLVIMTRGIALFECKIHISCVHDAQKKAKVHQSQLFAAIEFAFTPLGDKIVSSYLISYLWIFKILI